MNKYLFFTKVTIIAETEEEARTILMNDPTIIAAEAIMTNEKYTEKIIKGFSNRF